MQNRVTDSNNMIPAQGPLPCHTDLAGHTGSPPPPLQSKNVHNPQIWLNQTSFCGQEDQRDHGERSLATHFPGHPQRKSLLLREEPEGYREGCLLRSCHRDRKQEMQLPPACPEMIRTSFSIKQGQDSSMNHQTLSKVLRGAGIQLVFIYISNAAQHVHTTCIINCIL